MSNAANQLLVRQLPEELLHKIGGILKQSSRPVPFLPELVLWLDDWLPCWGQGRLYQILEDDRTHFQTPALLRYEQLRRRIRDRLAKSIREL